MSNLDKLLERGAQVVGGDLILRHKVVGNFRNGDFYATEEGLLELETVEVVAKEVKAPKGKKAAAETPETPEGDVTIDV